MSASTDPSQLAAYQQSDALVPARMLADLAAERDALRERLRRAESIVRMWNDGYAPWKGRHRDQCNGLYCDEGCIAQRVETLLKETP